MSACAVAGLHQKLVAPSHRGHGGVDPNRSRLTAAMAATTRRAVGPGNPVAADKPTLWQRAAGPPDLTSITAFQEQDGNILVSTVRVY